MDKWNPKANQIFAQSLESDAPRGRAAFLDDACGGDADLRAQVEALLKCHEEAGSFLEKPAAASVLTPAIAHWSGNTVKDAEYTLDFLVPSDNPDCLGTIGQYEISEVIGRGGMGIVLKGLDPKLNRVVAIKVLAPELASNASARLRFLREGQAAAAISHDHVVIIHGIDDSQVLPFIVMEYVCGQSLQDRIDATGLLELKEILRIGKQTAAGLAAAHAEGLVHRDIKPANLLLENGVERVKITDFGLARAVDDVRITKPGTLAGTPEYMSPEQARSESVDHRSDLFSLGCVLYAMCIGRPPFRADNTASIIRRICDDKPRPIQETNPEIPNWLAKLVEKLLAKDPGERFQSASEVAKLLGRYLAHVQDPSVNPAPPEFESLPQTTKSRPVAHRRARLVAASALVAVLLLGIGFTEATGVTAITPTIIRIVRGDGTLVIEVDDPEVSVSIDGDELVISGAGVKEIRLPAGRHELQAVKDGRPVQTQLVTITRGGRQVVRVDLEAGTPAAERLAANVVVRKVWDNADITGSVSRDGRYLSFVDWKTGDVAIRDLTTEKNRRLTNKGSWGDSAEFAMWPRFSPDGSEVAYLWYSSKIERYELRSVSVSGGEPRIIFPNSEGRLSDSFFDWSPDGKNLFAVLFDRGVAQLALISVADGSARVIKTLEQPRAIADLTASISPDGQYVAYSRRPDRDSLHRDIFLLRMDGTSEVPLVTGRQNESVIGWSPDGQWLVFGAKRDGGTDAWGIQVVNGAPRGTPRLLHMDLGAGSIMGLASDGTLFYGVDVGGPQVHIGRLDFEAGKVEIEPISSQFLSLGRSDKPTWSPNGEELAYSARSPGATSKIKVLSMRSGQVREIVPQVHFLGSFRWSPDGASFIATAQVTKPGGMAICRIDVQTGAATVVVPPPDSVRFHVARPTWTRDGSGIVYVKGNGIVYHDVNTSDEREILPVGNEEFETVPVLMIDVSPDDAGVAVFGREPESRAMVLKVFPRAGGKSRELLRIEKGRGTRGPVVWTPDGQHLLFVRHRPDDALRGLWRIPVDGGEPQKLAFEADVVVQDLAMHPDGDTIAFRGVGISPRKSEVWAMENFLPQLAAAAKQDPAK